MIDKEFIDIQVLLVEPSNTQQHIIKQFLIDLGITDIKSVTTGEETLNSINKSPPDLIMSSMYLADMTGVELVHNIRNDSNSYNMAFLLISSETKLKYLEPIRQAGAIAILPKPFLSRDLDIALSATLDYLNPQAIEINHIDNEDISVLVVDDSQISRNYISKILTDMGISQISTAVNGKQALELVNSQYFDLIVTDYNMPEMDGLQLTTCIRDESNQKTIPIIMVTSEKTSSRLAAIQNGDFAAILDKPFEPARIRQLIIQLLN